MNHRYHLCLYAIVIILIPSQLRSESQNVDLRFILDTEISCSDEVINYKVQIKTQAPSNKKFYGMNLRFFMEGQHLQFQAVQCVLNPFYSCNLVGVEINSFNIDLGLNTQTYVNINISGPFLGFLLTDISDSWLTIANLTFLPLQNLLDTDQYCEPLIWDLKQDQSVSFAGFNEGVVVVLFDEFEISTTNEFPQNENWLFSSNDSGVPSQVNCTTISCENLNQLMVTNCNDSGPGSLRHVLALAEENDTVLFAPQLDGDTIIISSFPLNILKHVVIAPSNEHSINIKSEVECIFDILGCSASISHLNLIGGTNLIGSSIVNNGFLNLGDITFNSTDIQNAGSSFILNKGLLTVSGDVRLVKYLP